MFPKFIKMFTREKVSAHYLVIFLPFFFFFPLLLFWEKNVLLFPHADVGTLGMPEVTLKSYRDSLIWYPVCSYD